MTSIVPCLWYDGAAEAAAKFYTSIIPNSSVDCVMRSPADNPSMKEGGVLTVEFTLNGQKYLGLNGGPEFKFTEAVSLQILCDDQAEVDRLWTAFTARGEESACGWLKDEWGLSWQITPKRLMELIKDPDPNRARKAMQAMMTMGKIDIAALERAVKD